MLQANGYFVRQSNAFYLEAILLKQVMPHQNEDEWYLETRRGIQTLQDEINETDSQCTYAACNLSEMGIKVEMVIL